MGLVDISLSICFLPVAVRCVTDKELFHPWSASPVKSFADGVRLISVSTSVKTLVDVKVVVPKLSKASPSLVVVVASLGAGCTVIVDAAVTKDPVFGGVLPLSQRVDPLATWNRYGPWLVSLAVIGSSRLRICVTVWKLVTVVCSVVVEGP